MLKELFEFSQSHLFNIWWGDLMNNSEGINPLLRYDDSRTANSLVHLTSCTLCFIFQQMCNVRSQQSNSACETCVKVVLSKREKASEEAELQHVYRVLCSEHWSFLW